MTWRGAAQVMAGAPAYIFGGGAMVCASESFRTTATRSIFRGC